MHVDGERCIQSYKHQTWKLDYLVLLAAGAAPPPCAVRRPVDAGVGEGDGVDGRRAADHHALEAMRRDAGGHDVPLVAPAAAPRPNLDEPLHFC